MLGSSLVVLEATDGEILLQTPPLGGVLACRAAILSIRMNALRDEAYERGTTSDGHFAFRLREPGGTVLASGARGLTEADRERVIDAIRRIAPVALITHSSTLVDLRELGVPTARSPAADDDDDDGRDRDRE